MLAPLGLILLLLASRGQCEDTLHRHTVSRIAELLSPSECHQLHEWLAEPEAALVEQELERLSEEKNPMGRRRLRRRRGLAGCSEALWSRLGMAGEAGTWDRLARGLRHVGRSDVAQELAKNLNQDLSLELSKSAEGLGRGGHRLAASPQLDGERRGGARAKRAPGAEPGDLRFERRPPPPYTRSLLGWLGPVVSGVLGGFLASVFLSVATAFACRWTLGPDAA